MAVPADLPLEEQRALAREAALRLLAVRERSAAELRSRLRRKGFAAAAIESVLERLREAGLQDDARFAEQFAEEAARSRGLAARRIQTELRARGLDRELAARSATASADEEEARARALAVRRARGLAGLAPEARARRLAGALARRGYDSEIAERVAREAAGLSAPD